MVQLCSGARIVSPEPAVPASGPAVVHSVSGIAVALCIRRFDDAVLIKKAPELVGRE